MFMLIVYLTAAVSAEPPSNEADAWSSVMTNVPDASFFENCVFISIDFQEGPKPPPYTKENFPPPYVRGGYTVETCNAAIDFQFEVAQPNAKRVADACRSIDLPMVFVHWGYQFKDGMDLDPATRKEFLLDMGENYELWPHHISHSSSKPSDFFGVREGEYVLAKTAQDAFSSCNITFVLQNLGAKRIVFIGGHTAGCLGGSAKHAKERGYQTLCVSDATFDAAESRRPIGIRDSNYDYVITTEAFLNLVKKAKE